MDYAISYTLIVLFYIFIEKVQVYTPFITYIYTCVDKVFIKNWNYI